MNLLDSTCNALEQVRLNRPLVHNITNYVVMNFTANALLAVGASPVMAHAREEVEDMVRLAGALVINIGTLSAPWIESMFKAGRAAAASSVPIVLDPGERCARQCVGDHLPGGCRGRSPWSGFHSFGG